MLHCEGNYLAEVYQDLLLNVYYRPQYITKPRNMEIKEYTNSVAIIKDPYSLTYENNIRSTPIKYLKDELKLYFSGRNDVKSFSEASKFWEKLVNPDNLTINSAYGYLIFVKQNIHKLTQFEWAKKCLLEDKDSRQAILHLNDSTHQYEGVKDFVCTVIYQFFIRNNKLNMTAYMRSQDLILGFPFDIAWELLLMQCMRIELLKKYSDLTLGELTHITGSIHIYENNFDLVDKMLRTDFNRPEEEVPPVVETPILREDLYNYNGNDSFLNWLCL